MSTISSSEKLCSQQVIDEENSPVHTVVHTESGTIPVLENVSIGYVQELEENSFRIGKLV